MMQSALRYVGRLKMIINIADVWEDASKSHIAFLTEAIDNGLKSLGSSDFEKEIYNFVDRNKETIINGSPEDLISSIEDFEISFDTACLPKAIDLLKKIFTYEVFSQKSDKPWNAYQLCNSAKYQTCCYCQMVETGTCLPDEDAKGYRPPIDHYYGKSTYPFLSLTLSNFVPCCEKCNGSQMKGSIDFAKKKHLNPLVDKESIQFQLDVLPHQQNNPAEALTLNLPKDQYYLKLVVTDNQNSSTASMKTFQLAERYENYSTKAYYLAKRLRGLSARKLMYDEALKFEIDVDLEFEPESYKQHPYGKARLDIAKQFGAIPE